MAVQWFLARNQQKIGPFTTAELKQLAACGDLQPGEHVLVEGATKWVEARTVPGLFPAEKQTRYWLSVEGKTRGPYVAEQVQAGLTTRQFTMDSQIYSEKTAKWVPLRQATEFHDFAPAAVSRSSAQLLAGSLDLEEARLHLAGKEGDIVAELTSRLLDLKRTYAHRPDLVATLDRSLALLRAHRDQPPAEVPKKPEPNLT